MPANARGKAAARAFELLRRPEVQLAIRAEMKQRDQRLRLSSERIVGEVMCIAFAIRAHRALWSKDGVELVDSGDLAADDRRAVKWISVGGRKASARSASKCTTSSRRSSSWRG